MNFNQRKALRLALILSGAVLLVVAGFALHGATATASTLETALAGVESGAVSLSPPPPVSQDTCLHCHIAGREQEPVDAVRALDGFRHVRNGLRLRRVPLRQRLDAAQAL
jgi:hypothetical protein